MCLGSDCLGPSVPRSVSFCSFGKFLAIIFISSSLSFPSRIPIISRLAHYIIPQVSYIASVFWFFNWLSVCCSNWVVSIILPSTTLIHSFVLFILLFTAFTSAFNKWIFWFFLAPLYINSWFPFIGLCISVDSLS